ncbi:hypothetical protein [Planomonospora sphaerica]|nr:hypothetical protein [Planomonospora sphaerica]
MHGRLQALGDGLGDRGRLLHGTQVWIRIAPRSEDPKEAHLFTLPASAVR